MIRRLSKSAGLFLRWLLMTSGVLAGSGLRAESPPIHGLPFIRSYPFGDIGNVPRGSLLGFDRFGRVAAIHDAVYTVLNDNVWLNIAEPGGKDRIPMANVIQAADGRSYFGGRGAWGRVEAGRDGRVHPVSLVPENGPAWLSTAVFVNLIPTKRGVYFASWNGLVYWDFQRQTNDLYEVPGLSRAFNIGDRVYISAYNAPLRYIDADARQIKPADAPDIATKVVEFSTTLDSDHTLLSFPDGRVAVFDGRDLHPWLPPEKNCIKGHVSVLQQLVDGRIAMGVTGQGLLLFSPTGELLLALAGSHYSNITALANREPGVLWVATEDSIDKVLYGSPLSAFGPALGLPIGWPIVARWHGRVYVASAGKLYESVAGNTGEPTQFELCPQQPPGGTFALAAAGDRMLVGNGGRLYAVAADGSYRQVPVVNDLVQLVMIDPEHCYAIGRSEIVLLEWSDGQWQAGAPIIPGVRNPAIVHRVGSSVWIEMGGDGVARLWRRDGRLHLDVVPNRSWTKGSWVNVGAVGDIVVLSSLREEPRRFFSERTGSWSEAPELQRLLDRSPYWVARVQQDDKGVIWATHNEGMVRFAPAGNTYDMDATTFDVVNDRYPIVRVLSGDDVWMYSERSLYHVEREWTTAVQKPTRPILVSLVDVQSNTEMLTGRALPASPLRLGFESNNLSFRFYAGGDGWRRVPAYEYRLSEREPWTAFDGSQLNLRTLHEGDYSIQVRLAGAQDEPQDIATTRLEIAPPWTRSWLAFTLVAVIAIATLVGAMRWSSYLARKRNRTLERVVQDRTRQLKATMAKLNEETRNTATLAERNRLAGEIHDSVQQGLTGAMLQLDTTLKLAAVTGDIRARLSVVRNMISYARQEAQHAIWDMESPLLDGTDLGDALRNLATLVDSGDAEIAVSVHGEPVALPRDVNHHLFRIAQEATTNASRHAQAHRISIELQYGGNVVALVVSDDGTGFRAEDVLQKHTGHLGLKGIRTRVRKIHGELEINSSAEGGTVIKVVAPAPVVEKEVHHAAANGR